MSNILAIDSSTEACSVAVSVDGIVTEEYADIPRQHAARILPMTQAALERAGMDFSRLDAVAFGRGPGSFTGLRIAAGVAQGIAYGINVPVIPVSTLATLARQAWRTKGVQYVLSCVDARIGEIYWGAFEVVDALPVPLEAEQLCTPETLALSAENAAVTWYGAGNGWRFYDQLDARVRGQVAEYDGRLLPRAGDMVVLAAQAWREGLSVPAEEAIPVYLRDRVTNRE